MKFLKLITLTLIALLTACANHRVDESSFTLAFGSCNNNHIEKNLWQEIQANNPDVWVWGGDIIYADNPDNDMGIIRDDYEVLKSSPAYSQFIKHNTIIGSWDDHDYGLNDGGVEFEKKQESQQLFLDFMDVPKNDARRKQKGIYSSHDYDVGEYKIKIIILDTRYFRSGLTEDPDPASDKRFMPNKYGDGTMLGSNQWNWLENQLLQSQADFNVILSSIQVLSPLHGFEKWANMPHELNKLENLLRYSNAKNVILLSGDRHISEISKKNIEGLKYPLIDFTSSGLNRALNFAKIEPNPYRVENNVVVDSFGLLHFDFAHNQVLMEIRGEDNTVLMSFQQDYLK
jgi:alkaline phosphatase D